MIIIDTNQLMIAAITRDTGGSTIDEKFVRHVTLNMIRSFRSKHRRQFGELVLAVDSKKPWRKDYFPFYKVNRDKIKDESLFDWDRIYELMRMMKSELQEFFPYKVIEVERCEGDDIIAVLTRYNTENAVREDTMFNEPEETLIVSNDKDFHQLHNQYVKQLSMKTKQFITLEKSVKETLHEHICKGDKLDGIPNVLSPDDTFVRVNKLRQKSIYETKVNEWFKELPKDEQFVKNYERNKRLIDLSLIPIDYQKKIINTYLNYEPNGREKLMKYFMSRRLSNLMEYIQDF